MPLSVCFDTAAAQDSDANAQSTLAAVFEGVFANGKCAPRAHFRFVLAGLAVWLLWTAFMFVMLSDPLYRRAFDAQNVLR